MNLHRLYLTENECYQKAQYIKPKGVMVHSTGANNPYLCRYVGPNDGLLGVNAYNNHWNTFRPGGHQKCVHAFIGKLADGSIATYQTLPWNMRGWHAGGRANDTHIGFEICEDGLTDGAYFAAVYREAAELTAHLCRQYELDPMADGVVICHAEGYRRGIASGHGDVEHWFPKHGKTMDDFRREVANIMKGDEDMDMDMEKIIKELSDRETLEILNRLLIENMTDAQALALLDRIQSALDKKELPEWAKEELDDAKACGLTDGTRPMRLMHRYEGAIMADRSMVETVVSTTRAALK